MDMKMEMQGIIQELKDYHRKVYKRKTTFTGQLEGMGFKAAIEMLERLLEVVDE